MVALSSCMEGGLLTLMESHSPSWRVAVSSWSRPTSAWKVASSSWFLHSHGSASLVPGQSLHIHVEGIVSSMSKAALPPQCLHSLHGRVASSPVYTCEHRLVVPIQACNSHHLQCVLQATRARAEQKLYTREQTPPQSWGYAVVIEGRQINFNVKLNFLYDTL